MSISHLLFFIFFASSSCLSTTHKCVARQSLDLLLFMQNLSFNNLSRDDRLYQDWFCPKYYPIMMNWNTSIDCCQWDGVTCNHSSGDVIGLDLSCGMLQGTIHSNSSLYNLPHLQILDLSYNDFTGTQLPPYINIMSLKVLRLRSIGLHGILPDNIFNLPYLEELDLSGNNNLTGPLPKVNTSAGIPLKELSLSSTNLSGKILESIGHLESLSYLDLSGTNLSGEIPDTVGHLKSLKTLRLGDCGLMGSLPKSLVNLRNLTEICLWHNMFNGTLPSWLFTIHSLEYILLDNNKFTGNVPFELFVLPSLIQLTLGHNRFDGQIDVFDEGPIQQTFRQLTNLVYLDLSFNNFRGEWELDTLFSSLINLDELHLSYSGLSVHTSNANHYVNPDFGILYLASCNLKVFPESLQAMKNLKHLNLSSNHIQGQIPDWAGEIGGNGLLVLDLSNNSITGLPTFQWQSLQDVFLQSNLIQGPFPPSICNMSILVQLDMSNNRFNGRIPQCLGNISSILLMVDLGNNHFHGTIPDVYKDCGGLKGFILNGNQLEGEVPTSWSKCQNLNIFDLGNNHLNGTFPGWLGDLPKLQALVLKSNNFHGPIISSSTINSQFTSLRVLDLSHNGFVGQLPGNYFQNFNAMKNVVKKSTRPEYLDKGGKYYSITATVKGVVQDFPQIFVDYIIIDLSNNEFEGEIPNIMGSLKALKVLNLSDNNLNGRIPQALGNLSEIESLDLSWNQLIGEIPITLADIKGLAVLNLSQNHLVGRIPQGRQFITFDGNSFGGNKGLCGFPLPTQCGQFEGGGDDDDDDDEEESKFSWKVVMLGYGCGNVIGLVLGYLMLSTRKPKWFNAIYDETEHMILKRQNKRRYIFIGK